MRGARTVREGASTRRLPHDIGKRPVNFAWAELSEIGKAFATRAIEAGMQPQVLKTILGHSSLAMTMDLYSHVMEDIKADEMEKIESAF